MRVRNPYAPCVFIDIDGTLAEWREAAKYEELFEKGYFRTLRPYEPVLEAVRILINEKVEVYALSAYIPESEYALSEKKEWLAEHLPSLPKTRQLFCKQGRNKAWQVMKRFKQQKKPMSAFGKNCILLDDYSENLHQWAKSGGTGIKLMNGLNGTHGSWKGPAVSRFDSPKEIADGILSFVKGKGETVHALQKMRGI